MIEADIENHLIRCAVQHGGEVRKVKWIGRRGAPDRLVLLPGRHVLFELKRPGKSATAAQIREHNKLRKAGFEVYVTNDVHFINAFFAGLPRRT